MKKTLVLLAAGLSAGILIASPFIATAQTTQVPPNGSPTNVQQVPPNGAGNTEGVLDTEEKVIGLINKIINWMFTIFISVAIIMFIYAAFIYLTAGGGENVGTAHKMIMYGAIAVAVATLSRGLVSLVQNFVTKV